MNNELLKVLSLKYCGGYRVEVRFSDGNEGIIDLKDHIWGEVFEPLKNESEFAKMEIKWGTIAWSCGADLAPEFLRDVLLGKDSSQVHVAED
ncbi:DUF2442 domain-containing protein [Nibricoccus sp. IMCC34717]|uniref:DUF2442 domain-containing protein n=1 Tax=Nibricoccus sp. IMCC34717 TaxID=3034021 RepID=UPI00384C1E72